MECASKRFLPPVGASVCMGDGIESIKRLSVDDMAPWGAQNGRIWMVSPWNINIRGTIVFFFGFMDDDRAKC